MNSSRAKLGATTLVVLVGTVVLVVGVPTAALLTSCIRAAEGGTVVGERCRQSGLPVWATDAAVVVGTALLVGGQWSFWRTSGGTGRPSAVVVDVVVLACGLSVAYAYGVWFWNLLTSDAVTIDPGNGVIAVLAILGSALALTGGVRLWRDVRAE